ncbi:MAG: fumarylacetoacetate hydrolase, partial [Alphaproteobacteria bacterium]|nr:fumarylacetoacetate hydrolase [Alphaproteobacteria bacterium]
MLPDDLGDATLAGRIALPQGPSPVLIRDGFVEDMSAVAPTMADLLD